MRVRGKPSAVSSWQRPGREERVQSKICSPTFIGRLGLEGGV